MGVRLFSGILEITNQQQFLIVILLTVAAWGLVSFAHHSIFKSSIADWVRTATWKGPLLCVACVLVIRGGLVPIMGIPQPKIHDEFSMQLTGDTFAHFRLTNPTPAASHHFETFHENMVPTYNSKFWIGHGMVLAIGQVIFHEQWVGIFVATALMAGSICWGLQPFVGASWAFFGGLLCALRIGVLSYWMNSYWGGSLAALGGALALGGVARLMRNTVSRRVATLLGLMIGLGLALMGTTRPFEGTLFSTPLALWAVAELWRSRNVPESRSRLLRAFVSTSCVVGAVLVFLAYYNYRTTGDIALTPYSVYEARYASGPLFLWGSPKSVPAYTNAMMRDFYQNWEMEFYSVTRTRNGFLYSEEFRRVQLWVFFIGSILSIPLLVGIAVSMFRPRLRILLWCGIATFLAYSVTVFFQPHYFAPATVIVYGVIAAGLQQMWQSRSSLMKSLTGSICCVSLVFALVDSFNSIYVSEADRPNRTLVSKWVGSLPGKHLIVVSYTPGHATHYELVFNGADFATEKILWARALGPAEDQELCRAYPDRMFWDVTTNDHKLIVAPSSLCQKQRPAVGN